tara:strand:+ start:16703 stop:17053 length:351 start_codon:yes stop_codon:yes gene_type:complete
MSIIQRINIKGQSMQVHRPNYTRDSVGSRKQTFIPRTTIKGYVASRSVNESFVGDRQAAQETVTVYVQGGSDVLVTDRLKIDQTFYEVTGKRTPGHRGVGNRLYYHIIDAVSNEGV